MIEFSLSKPLAHDEAGRPWYDTKKGIAESLKSLEGLCRLVAERRTAGYEREERLNEFCILGRYNLDSCGNCLEATRRMPNEIVPKEILPDIPDVLTSDEFWAYIQEKTGKKDSWLSFSMANLPLPGLKCAKCGISWEIQNCHDNVVWRETEVLPLTDFIGKTLRDVKEAYGRRDDAVFRMQSDILIRNDKHIDLTPDPKYPTLKKNERGWLREKDGVTDDYVIQEGDEGYFNVWRFFHHTCNSEHLLQETARQFRSIFEKAGFKEIWMASLPNEYYPSDYSTPWFNVTTEFGKIKIGWRKRVINIDWSAMEKTLKASGKLPKQSILSLFDKEDVTKGDTFIHAWGWEKAQDYLSRIYGLLS